MAPETVLIEGVVAGGDNVRPTTQAGSEHTVDSKAALATASPVVQKAPLAVFESSAPVSTMRGATPPSKPEPNGDPPAETAASNNAFETPRAPHVRRSPPGSGPSEEAAALLLNFSTVGDHVPLPSIAEHAAYPHTPPNDSPTAPPRDSAAPVSLAVSSPPGLPTPSAASPETSTTKPPKQKRKRNANAVAGPSRQSSAEPGRPPHSMGEDNTLIRCICGFVEDDGFTIQCEGCYAWEHGQCFGYPEEDSVPDIYYCELCEPRPVDTTAARLVQLQSRATWESRRLARVNEIVALEQAKKSRAKPKRPRTDSGKENEPQEESQDPAAAAAATAATAATGGSTTPSGTKPRRKQHPNKQPKLRTAEGGSYSLKDAPEDDDYFRSTPWELEYTPLKDSVIRGVAARNAVSQLHREWVDGEEVPLPSKRQQPSYHASGLPSPTDTSVVRLSPDNLLSPPDFGILAPPVPPVFLSGRDLGALASPTSIRPVEDSACFLPLKYSEPSAGIYARPTIYGVFTQDVAAAGAFFGEYRCEILDTATYRRDAINQYSALGIPKPYVHSIGPPVNLMLDARSYGNELRFVRSGCHPNAVIRPVFHRADNSKPAKLVFGIFASRELAKNEEIVLAWEWDDQHAVHTLRAIIDSTLKNAATKPLYIAPETVEHLTRKFDSILTNVLGTFQSCACSVNTDCAFAQMRRLVNGQTFHGVSGARARKRIDLGELVGAVRGWRRRELEAAAASAKARRFRTSGEWDIWRAGPISAGGDEVNTQPSRPQSEQASSDSREEDEAEADETKDEAGEEEDEGMDVEPQEESPESEVKTAGPPRAPSEEDLDDAMDVDTKENDAENTVETDVVDAGPSTPKASISAPPLPSSSVLSSLPSEHAGPQDEEGEEELSSGHESDATTITLARSTFSDGESDAEDRKVPGSDAADDEVRPAPARRGRRVVSPAVEAKPVRRAKPTPTPRSKATKDGKRRARKNVIASSEEDGSSEDDDEPPTPKVKARPRPVGLKASKGRRRAPDSDDEAPPKQRKTSVARKQKRKVIEQPSSPIPAKDEPTPEPAREPSPPPAKEATPVPEVASPPPTMPTPPPRAATPPPRAATPPPVREATPPLKEATPPPKEVTPPPKEPTPPPPKKVSMKEYLATHKIRKVSNPAVTKDVNTEAAEETASNDPSPPETVAQTPAIPPAPAPSATGPTPPSRLNLMEHLPSSRGASLTPLPTPFTPTTPLSASSTSSAYVPRTDYFGSQPAAPAPSTAAYVPRQSSSSYVPREEASTAPTSAYVPRQDKDHLPLVSPIASRPPLPQQTPPRPPHSLPEIPPALGVRDGPPHYAHHSHRPPPTGPRIPPTGPRGGWSGPPGSGARPASGPVSPNAPLRGGFSRGGYSRGGFERGGFGFRGRGGLRGRGRGM